MAGDILDGGSMLRRPRTLERKLPLLMSGILVVVFATVLGATYGWLTRAARDVAQSSLSRATQQLARLLETSIASSGARYRAVANDLLVRQALANGANGVSSPSHALDTVLARVRTPTDSGAAIELWTAGGQRVAFIGDDRLAQLAAPSGDVHPRNRAWFDGFDRLPAADSIQFGKLFVADGRVRAWTVLPILNHASVIGYVAKENRIAANPQTERSIRALAGGAVAMFYRNADSSLWTTLTGKVTSAALAGPEAGSRMRPKIGPVLFGEEPIAGTPLVVVMETPLDQVLAGPRNIIRSLALLSLVLLVGGTIVAWSIARRITAPLGNITQAAATIARGDYATRVPPEGDVELVRLADSFNEMVREIGTSREALENQTAVARAASRAKSDFLATMSHELRTPLNAIGGYVELLEMELRGPINEMQRRDLFRIRAAQQHVLGLISGMLDLSRIEAGRVSYDLQPIALDSFLAGLDVLVAPQAETKSFTLDHVPPDATLGVLADREKLRQILLNLLSNAIRHTPAGGRITLDAVALDTETVAIEVRDTGPGIPESRHADIFEPFVQLDRSLSQPREGVGLGLAISRDLARGMGGDLSVRNQPSGGACFTVALRRAMITETTPHIAFTGEMPLGLPASAPTNGDAPAGAAKRPQSA